MLRLRVRYGEPAELARALEEEIARGVLLVRVTPPETLAFRDVVSLELVAATGRVVIETEVVSLFPEVGVVVAFPAQRVGEARALGASGGGAAVHEIVAEADEDEATREARGPVVGAMAEKVRLARHGTREDRAMLLRDPNRTLHALVIKCPQVTIDEVAGWAKNAQLGPDFLRQIAERKDWLSRPNIAQALVRNPKTPPEIAVRALDHVGVEALRQMVKGVGVAPHVAAAARKKALR